MPLSTFAELPFTSPLAAVGHVTTQPTAAASVTMADISHNALIHIRGNAAAQVLRTIYEIVPDMPGNAAMVSAGVLGRLRADEFVLFVGLGSVNDAMQNLTSAVGSAHMTLTDLTHGRAGIALGGVHAANVLPKVCGLDFHESVFPDLHIAQTSLAKVRTLILRHDSPSARAYRLVVERSLGAYVWGVVYDAMQEWNGVIVASPEPG
jgi:sarcosine oxidase, subunit gamma